MATPPRHPERIVFLGTPEAAVPSLRALVDAGFDVPLVISRADRRRGRRAAPTPSPVKAAALDLGIEVSTCVDDVLSVGADLGVVVAFGRIISTSVLQSLPFLNVHFSLLPRWRGAAPVERAILAGDDETGVCIMGLEPSLDTGPVYSRRRMPIGTLTAAELRSQLGTIGADLLVSTLAVGLGQPEPQHGEATFAAKIDATTREIDWQLSASEIERIVRVGGAWTSWRGKRLLVHVVNIVDETDASTSEPGVLDAERVATANGWLELVEVQPEGKGRVSAGAWLNGARPGPEDRLGR
ncbi:MAG: methionyl-tRNA formyltransferase [Actinomycetia bacterium]|nr:methionyl-tRNA formyltransferase [Actinomycetes bacterium]MCP4958915.1 methionyl-tRNA formyltransferase [Actinomycetes bacterium]